MALPFGDGELDLDRRELRAVDGDGNSRAVALTTKEAELLAYLVARPGRVVGWDELHREIWGHGPRVVSRAAYFTWRRVVHKLEPEPDRPIHLVSHHGGGVAFVPRAGEARPPPSDPVAPRTATNVGRALDRGFGRAADHARFDALWRGEVRLVTVVGPGGVGKTRFARDVAERLLQRGEVWWCDAAGCADTDEIEARIAGIVDAPRAIDARRALDARGAVVVIDEVDGMAPAIGRWCRGWLADTRALRFVVTGRERTNQPGEAVIALGPLDGEAAAALYVDRVLKVQPDWDVAGWHADIARLVHRLDGLPLAIELAAARCASPRELSGLLDDRFAVLGREGDPSRHGSLWAAMEASWVPLAPDERRAFARLAVFRGGFDLPAAEAVLAEVGGGRLGAVDLLDRLCRASLVWAAPAGGGRGLRFGLYETLRAYAEAKLDAAGGDGSSERVAAEEAHAAWYGGRALALLDATSGAGPPVPDDQIAPDRDNLSAVWARQPVGRADPSAAACVAALVWLDRGRSGARWLAGALDHAVRDASGPLAVILRVHRALARVRLGQFDGAWTDADEARRLAEQALPPDAPWRARAEVAVAQVAYHRGEPDGMFDALDRAGARLPSSARRLAAKVDEMRVLALLDLGRLAEARHVGLRLLARLRGDDEAGAAGDRFAHAVVCCHLAAVELALGRSAAAERLLDEAQATFRAVSAPGELGYPEASTLVLRSIAQMEAAAYAAAEGTLRSALTAYERLGSASGVAQARHNLGIACLALGRADEGRELLLAALDADRADGNRRAAPLAWVTLAMDAVTRGDRAGAEAALAEVGAPNQRRARVRALCVRAVAAARFGDADALERAVIALDDAGGPFEGESGAFARAARAYARGEDPAAAGSGGDDRFHVVRWVRGLPARR